MSVRKSDRERLRKTEEVWGKNEDLNHKITP